jgi:threonine dehydrogenase-like Zn-dependent dehydrogenase
LAGLEYAGVPDGGSVLILGLGPIGDMASRIAQQKWIDTIIAVDLVDERLARAIARGIQVIDLREHEDDLADVVRELTDGRGPDSVIDAVGMEAHGSPTAAVAQQVTAHLPDKIIEPLVKKAGLDRLAAVYTAIETVRRGGTVSLSGVYGGMADPMPMMSLFDKQIQLRMGQANVKRWIPDIMPFLTEEDPLGVDEFATHRLPLAEAPAAYEMFQHKADGAVKIMLKP